MRRPGCGHSYDRTVHPAARPAAVRRRTARPDRVGRRGPRTRLPRRIDLPQPVVPPMVRAPRRRLHALWLAWQELTDPATCGYTGPSVWHRDHLDPCMRELRPSNSPFAGCTKASTRLTTACPAPSPAHGAGAHEATAIPGARPANARAGPPERGQPAVLPVRPTAPWSDPRHTRAAVRRESNKAMDAAAQPASPSL
ncbi:DUF4913 domain-containing protein [Streptomyces lavendulocolor]|uniref:DUF4913 domain-containing protein n=1 Tax=Streptomyces lavendulocolor TaxID=67316 RepID=UPI003C2DA236